MISSIEANDYIFESTHCDSGKTKAQTCDCRVAPRSICLHRKYYLFPH
jgi:hypothetical protein